MRRSVVPGGPHPCAGRAELFLAPSVEAADVRRAREDAAKAICGTCDAREACLEVAAVNHRLYGGRVDLDVWGGLTAVERRELYRLAAGRAS